MSPLKRILLAEDSEGDIELTLAALEEYHLANEVFVVRDGVGALDYLHHRGKHTGHWNGQPVVVLLDLKMPKMDGLEVLRQMKDVTKDGLNGYEVLAELRADPAKAPRSITGQQIRSRIS